MNESPEFIRQLEQQLTQFAERAETVWKEYQSHGPGRVDSQLFDAVEETSRALTPLLQDFETSDWSDGASSQAEPKQWASQIHTAVDVARDLAHRCACRSEGLCFVTGEAGLIPRRDQHEAFESVLKQIHEHCHELQRRIDPDES